MRQILSYPNVRAGLSKQRIESLLIFNTLLQGGALRAGAELSEAMHAIGRLAMTQPWLLR